MNNWEPRLLPPEGADEPLAQQVARLLEQQRSTWDLFRNGEAARSGIVTKRLTVDGCDVIVQSNPGRSRSTNAIVDAKSVAKRPCFLCPDALSPQERGIAFGDYIVLPNPYPVLPNHLTIPFRQHELQHIDGRFFDLFVLAEALGPFFFVLYNGPRCGASAPDHLHFQACSADEVPVFEQLPGPDRTPTLQPHSLGGRNCIVGTFLTAHDAADQFSRVLDTFRDLTAEKREPMVNVIARFHEGHFTIVLFPRQKHRSACFFAGPSEQLSISPAAVEMAGIVVVADANHFERVTPETVTSIYREVTLDDERFSRLAETLQ